MAERLSGNAGAVAAFAAGLRELRRASGSPSYAVLARKTGVPRSTLHDGLSGNRLPNLETTLAIVAVCGGDSAEWKRRWMAVRGELEEAPRTPRIPYARLCIIAAVIAVVLGAGVFVAVKLATPCAPVREYRVDTAGAVIDATGTPIGKIGVGDTVDVASLAHDRYPHRYYAIVRGTGVRGYIDEAKLTFVRETCA